MHDHQRRHLQHGAITPEAMHGVAAGLDKVLSTTPGLHHTQHTFAMTHITPGISILPECVPLALAALQSPLPSVRTVGASQLGAMLHVRHHTHLKNHHQHAHIPMQHLGSDTPQRGDALQSLVRALGDSHTTVAHAAQQAIIRTTSTPEGLAAVMDAAGGGALAALTDSTDATLRLRGLSLASALIAQHPGVCVLLLLLLLLLRYIVLAWHVHRCRAGGGCTALAAAATAPIAARHPGAHRKEQSATAGVAAMVSLHTSVVISYVFISYTNNTFQTCMRYHCCCQHLLLACHRTCSGA